MLENSQKAQSEEPSKDDFFREPLSSLGIELARISAEIHSINSGFQVHFEQAVSDARREMERQFTLCLENSRDEARQQVELQLRQEFNEKLEIELTKRSEAIIRARAEAGRVSIELEALTKEIELMLDDPAVQLSFIIRKKAEQSELKAYLNGVRYSIGEEL